MSRPSFQFYTKDWRSNSKLRRCSPAARGVWVDILCALHDSDEYGVARYPLKELANEVGASMAHVRELVEKGVLKGSDARLEEPLIYRPRSGRREGAPVTLLEAQAGPIWFSSRMLKDEYVRTVRGAATRFGADDDGSPEGGEGAPPKPPRKPSPKPPFGDGSASASATAVVVPPNPPKGVRSSALTLGGWLKAVKERGERAIPDDDPVVTYANSVGLPGEFLLLAWKEFKARHLAPNGKRYTDWRKTFLNAVRGNYLKLWYLDGEEFKLTTTGLQAKRAHGGDAGGEGGS